MKGKLRKLVDDLCVDWGFCIPSYAGDKIVALDEISADQFAQLILEAEFEEEGPEYEVKWKRKIRNRFIETFGTDFVRLEE